MAPSGLKLVATQPDKQLLLLRVFHSSIGCVGYMRPQRVTCAAFRLTVIGMP